MAVASLGRLTLDLAVRLSDFTDGMSRAERETAERTQNMQNSVRAFRDNLAEQLSGTQIGGIIDGLNARFDSLNGSILKMSGALAGMAVGGAVVALGSLAQMAMETAKADAEMAVFANRANASVQNFQALTVAAQGLGISQDQLGSILADTQEKLGEFSATAGGGAADFFEALQNNTKMSDEAIREFGKTLQGKDGVEAIQMIKDKLDELGASAQEQRFVLESLGSDLGNLSIIFDNGGAILGQYREALEEAGVIKSKEAIEQSQLLAAQMQSTHQRFEGFKSQLAGQMIPILGTLGQHFLSSGKQGSSFGYIIQGVGTIAKGVAIAIVTVGAVVAQFGDTIGQVMAQLVNIGSTAYDFMMADGLLEKIGVLNRSVGNFQGMAKSYADNTTNRIKSTINTINNIYTGAASATDVLTSANLSLMRAENERTKGLRLNTATAEANAKANEKAAKSAKSAKSNEIIGGNHNQNMVYKAWLSTGLSDNQARIITAEVGRENDYQSRYLFGGHNDPANGKYNLGMISWQGKNRGGELYKYLNARGFIKNGKIVQSQESLNAQAAFAVNEMRTKSDYRRTRDVFLANPNISYQKGVEVLGRNYIRWRYTDPNFSKHHNRRDAHYNALNRTLQNNPKAVGKAGSSQAVETLKEQEKEHEELERNKQTIIQRYATENERNLIQHQENLKSTNKTYAQGSAEWKQYTDKETQRYQDMIAENELDRKLRYAAGEEKLELEYQKKIQQIKKDFAEDDPARETMLKKAKEAYQKDLANFKWAQGEKARAQKALADKLAADIGASTMQSNSTYLDYSMKKSMSPEEYSKWRLQQDYQSSATDIMGKYSARDAQINAVDSEGKYALDDKQRYELQLAAREEFNAQMLALDTDYATKTADLDKQLAEARSATISGMFGSMTDAAASFFGEQSAMYKVAFAMQKAYAVYKAVMNIQETYSNTFNAVSAIPVIGPYIAAPMAAAASAIQVAQAAKLKGMQAPSVAGVAHGGLDYVPSESTFLLDEGERVLSPRQNKDLTKYLNDRKDAQGGDIYINNNSSAQVSAQRNPDGTVTIDVVDKMIKQAFGRIGQPNSFESQQIQRNTTARFKR